MATLSHHPWVFGVIIHGCHHLWAFRVITGGHWRPSPIVTRIITHGCWVHHAWAFGAITHVAITCGHWGPSLISAPRQRRCACLTPIPAPHRVPRGRAVPGCAMRGPRRAAARLLRASELQVPGCRGPRGRAGGGARRGSPRPADVYEPRRRVDAGGSGAERLGTAWSGVTPGPSDVLGSRAGLR